jgi:hypothetical protein
LVRISKPVPVAAVGTLRFTVWLVGNPQAFFVEWCGLQPSQSNQLFSFVKKERNSRYGVRSDLPELQYGGPIGIRALQGGQAALPPH